MSMNIQLIVADSSSNWIKHTVRTLPQSFVCNGIFRSSSISQTLLLFMLALNPHCWLKHFVLSSVKSRLMFNITV